MTPADRTVERVREYTDRGMAWGLAIFKADNTASDQAWDKSHKTVAQIPSPPETIAGEEVAQNIAYKTR